MPLFDLGVGVLGNAIWSAIVAVWRRVVGHTLHITSPRPQEPLSDPKPLGGSRSFAVRRTLRRLSADHAIWLLNQDERTGEVWPQGFSPVQVDRARGTWEGRVHGRNVGAIKIVAVVAPPTSQDLFNYFQILGDKTEVYHPLRRIPPECKNRAEVQARVPS